MESWFVKRGYRLESESREVQRVNSIDGQVLLGKTPQDLRRKCHFSFNFLPCFIHHIRYFKICSWNYSPTLKPILPKLYGEGRRNFKHEKLIEYFYSENHNVTHQDINVRIIDICDPNDQEKCENFWKNKLKTFYPESLNYKRVNHY